MARCQCAFGGPCSDPLCPFRDMWRRFPPRVQCPNVLADGKKRRRCRFVIGHRPPCKPSSAKKDVIEAEEDRWWT